MSASSADQTDLIRFIGPLKVKKEDFYKVMEISGNGVHADTGFGSKYRRWLIASIIVLTSVAYISLETVDPKSAFWVAFLIITSGWLCDQIWYSARVRLRRRQLAMHWAGISSVPEDLNLYETSDGLRWVGGDYQFDLPWVAIAWMRKRSGYWYAASREGALVWMPESSFRDLFYFDQFAQWAVRMQEARGIPHAGFEVVFRPARTNASETFH